MDFSFSEEQILFRDSIRKLMDRIATPDYVRRLDQDQIYPNELYAAWVEAGLLRMPFPEKYGGLNGNAIDMVIISEELSRKNFDFFTAYGGSVFCGLNVVKKGTEAQAGYWVPKLLSGQIKMSISMSESDAGSDVGAMRTNAHRVADGWCINGRKLWASGAGAKGNVVNVYVKTDPKANFREGISLFLVPNDTPGLTCRKLDMLGRRSVGLYELTFDDVVVPETHLIGGENKGWGCVLSGLQIERLTAAAGYCGGAQAVFDLALQYAKERHQFGRAIGNFQAIAHNLVNMETEIEAARTMIWRAAWLLSQGQDALREITMAKLLSSETYTKAANTGMQIMGAFGYSMEFDMQRHYRDSRSATIGAGTSELQRNLLAGRLGLKLQ